MNTAIIEEFEGNLKIHTVYLKPKGAEPFFVPRQKEGATYYEVEFDPSQTNVDDMSPQKLGNGNVRLVLDPMKRQTRLEKIRFEKKQEAEKKRREAKIDLGIMLNDNLLGRGYDIDQLKAYSQALDNWAANDAALDAVERVEQIPLPAKPKR